jgi:HEAT repeat protein
MNKRIRSRKFLVFLSLLVLAFVFPLWSIIHSVKVEQEILRALRLGDQHGRMPPAGTNLLVNLRRSAIPILLRWSYGKDPAWYKAADLFRKFLHQPPLGGKRWEHKEDARKAFAALRAHGTPAVPALVRRLSDPDPDVRRYSIHILGAIGPSIGPEAFTQMTNRLTDPDNNGRNDVIWALQFHRPTEYPTKTLIPVFLAGLKDSFHVVRENAINGLLLLGENPSARSAIEKALADSDAAVRSQAQLWLDKKFRKEWDPE